MYLVVHHVSLQVQVLFPDLLQQLIVDQVVVPEPDGHHGQGEEAEEDRDVPHHPDPAAHHLPQLHLHGRAAGGGRLRGETELDDGSLQAEVDSE